MDKQDTKMLETPKATKAAEREGILLVKYATEAPEATKKEEGPRNAPTRRETGDTTEDKKRTWQFIVCKLPATSPEKLTAHMMGNHWDDKWTIRIENPLLGIKITMRDANDQAQTKNTSATTKNTKRTIKVVTEDATEFRI